MSNSKLRNLSIDRALFGLALDQDVDFQECPTSHYLDLQTGEVEWVYENDEDAYMQTGIPAEDNRAIREKIEATPNHYLELPGLERGDYHELLREFLDSDWTDDAEKHARVRNAYTGSIGRWKRSLEDRRIVHAFNNYCDRRKEQMGEEFLREHGIEPNWR